MQSIRPTDIIGDIALSNSYRTQGGHTRHYLTHQYTWIDTV